MPWNKPDRPIKSPRQLLVEGVTDALFFSKWIEQLGATDQPEVRDFHGVKNLAPFLKDLAGRPEFREQVVSLAIIRDAEDKPAADAFKSVCDSLEKAKLKPPEDLAVFSSGMPRIGIYILPDCQDCGMLETLCWNVLQKDLDALPHLKCVEGYLACLRQVKAKPQNEIKAKVWAFLAGKGEFDPQVGRAAQKGVWDWKSEALAKLRAFLTEFLAQNHHAVGI